MQRRNLLIGIGSIAAGSAATLGTGAFTTVSAERTTQVNVAADSSGYVGISANGPYASGTGDGQLELDFSSSNSQGVFGDGEGLNPDSEYHFDNVFQVANQGPGGDVRVICTTSGFNLENLEIEAVGGTGLQSNPKSLLAKDYDDSINAPKLVEPDSFTVDMTIETKGSTDGDAGGTITIHAARGNEYESAEFSSVF
jgi:hypothetical protein